MNPDNAMNLNKISLTPEEVLQMQARLQLAQQQHQQQGARNLGLDGSGGGAGNAGLNVASLQSPLWTAAPNTISGPVPGIRYMYPNMYMYSPYVGSVNAHHPMTADTATFSNPTAQQNLLTPPFSTSMGLDARDARVPPIASHLALSSISPSASQSSVSDASILASSMADEKLLRLIGIGRRVSGKGSRRKKPKDMPKRPLSAYNLFFKDERERIVNSKDEDKSKQDDADTRSADDDTEKTSSSSLSPSRSKASGRSSRVPHGKIGFANLAKIVGARWKELTTDRLEYYQSLAEEDMERYKKEMQEYHKAQDTKRKISKEEENQQATEEKRKRKETQEKIDEELEKACQQIKKRKVLDTGTAFAAAVPAATSTPVTNISFDAPIDQANILHLPHATLPFQSTYAHTALQGQALSKAYLSQLQSVLQNQNQQQQKQAAISSAGTASSNNDPPSSSAASAGSISQQLQQQQQEKAALLQHLAMLRAGNNFSKWM